MMGYVEVKNIALQIDNGIDDLRMLVEEDDGKVGEDVELAFRLEILAEASAAVIQHINRRMP